MNLKTLKAMALTGEFNFESNSTDCAAETVTAYEQAAPQTGRILEAGATR